MDAETLPAPRNGRELTMLRMVNVAGLGLEIGPAWRPIAPKARGYRIEIVDVCDTDTLRARHPNSPEVEPVDYLFKGSLRETIPHREHYDYIIASHVIEHQPNLVGFLQDCAALLKPDGVLSLAVPDKRYCFDAARPHSSLANVLRAHAEKRTRPDPFDVLDHHLSTVHNGEVVAWRPNYGLDLSPLYTSELARFRMRQAQAGEYVDTHCWQFVPSSFRLLMRDLHMLGEITLSEIAFTDTGGTSAEFFVTMAKHAPSADIERIELQRRIIAELAAS